MSAPTIRNLIDDWADDILSKRQRRSLTSEQREALEARLMGREDGIGDFLRLAAMQFGMYPFIVAKVLSQTGLGTPLSEEQQQMIHDAYIEGMTSLMEAQRRAQEGDDTN